MHPVKHALGYIGEIYGGTKKETKNVFEIVSFLLIFLHRQKLIVNVIVINHKWAGKSIEMRVYCMSMTLLTNLYFRNYMHYYIHSNPISNA